MVGRETIGLVVAAGDDGIADARGEYVEKYWLPVIGPACIVALRRISRWLEDSESGRVDIGVDELGRSLGLGAGTGTGSPVARTIARLVDYGLAHEDGHRLAVRVLVPTLTERQAQRLPEALAASHQAAVRELAGQ